MTIWTHYGNFTADNNAFQSDEFRDQVEGILMANQTEQQIAWAQYWTAYRDFLISKEPDVRWPKASPQAYYDRGFGKTDVKLSTHVGFSNKMITMHIVFQKAKADARFKQLRRDKERFEARFGEPLQWLAEAACDRHIRITLHSDPADRSKWQTQHEWLYQQRQRFQSTFAEAVASL